MRHSRGKKKIVFLKINLLILEIHITFEMLDQQELEDFNDIYRKVKLPNHHGCRTFFNGNIALLHVQQFTKFYWLSS